MSTGYGDCILAVLAEEFGVEPQSDEHNIYNLTVGSFQVQVVVDPSRELGLRLTYISDGGRRSRLRYYVDTDLYKLSDPANKVFIEDIESQICTVLAALAAGGITVGKHKGRPAMVIPVTDGCELVYAALTSTTTRHLHSMDEARIHGFVSDAMPS